MDIFGLGVGTSWKKMDDAALIIALSQGKERAFSELVRRYQPGLYHFAVRFCGINEEAEDAVQETLLRLFKNRHRLETTGSIRAFLYKVCRNVLIDAARKKRPEPLGETVNMDPTPSALESLSHKEGASAISQALHRLPESQRTAMLLRHTEELSYAEIAEVMNTSLSAVESLLVRGRRTLRKRLAASPERRPGAP